MQRQRHENERPPERQFMTKRYKVKKGKRLLKAQAKLPEILTDAEKKEYFEKVDEDERMSQVKVVMKGEPYTEDPAEPTNPEEFNQQVSDEDLAALREKCTVKQFVQVVRFLPEFNFSVEGTYNFVATKCKETPCMECQVPGCCRRQERWQARVLHGCYPQEPLSKFEHKKMHQKPCCYFVNARKGTLTSDRYLDVMDDFDDINFHLTGKERVRVFRRPVFVNPPEPDHSDSDSDSEEENGEEKVADEKVEMNGAEQNGK